MSVWPENSHHLLLYLKTAFHFWMISVLFRWSTIRYIKWSQLPVSFIIFKIVDPGINHLVIIGVGRWQLFISNFWYGVLWPCEIFLYRKTSHEFSWDCFNLKIKHNLESVVVFFFFKYNCAKSNSEIKALYLICYFQHISQKDERRKQSKSLNKAEIL